jgi:hypothetical protein
MKNKIFYAVFVIFLTGCSSPELRNNNSQPVASTIKTFRYMNGTVCQEKKGPPIFNLGIECICNNYPSHTVSKRSNLPGYTSQCIDPATWDKEELEIRNAERTRVANEERINKENEVKRELKQKQDQAVIDKFKASPEGKRFINYCVQEQKKYEQVEYSCAAAYDKKSCVRTRYSNFKAMTECSAAGVSIGGFPFIN